MLPADAMDVVSPIPAWADPGCAFRRIPAEAVGQVHLWRADLGELGECVEALESLVPQDERSRYGLDRDLRGSESERADQGEMQRGSLTSTRGAVRRSMRGAMRGLVRLILSRYLPDLPSRLPLTVEAQGRPTLAADYPGPRIHWSLSHTEGKLVLAVAMSSRIGVDMESMAREIPVDALSKRFFSEYETNNLLEMKAQERREVFLRYWTAKEAVAKATGHGLASSLKQCEVDWVIGASSAAVRDTLDSRCGLWPVRFFEVYSGYGAALTVDGDTRSVGFWTVLPAVVRGWLSERSG